MPQALPQSRRQARYAQTAALEPEPMDLSPASRTAMTLPAPLSLIVAQTIAILLNLSLGRNFPGASMLLAPVLGALLWPLVDFFATRPRFRRRLGRMIS